MRKYFVLKCVLILISLIILILSIYGLVGYFNNGPFNQEYAKILYPPFIGLYVSTLLMYLGLFSTYRVIRNIENKQRYSISTYRNLGYIQIYSSVITFIYLGMAPFVFYIADKDDAPGLILINVVLILVFFIISASSLLLGKHVKEVIEDRELEKE